MPPRRRAAAAAAAAAAAPPAPPATPPLDGCTIALSGKFDSINHNHSSLESLVRSLGGGFSKSVTKNTTHVVCTQEDYDSEATKVAHAKTKDLKIVGPNWILEAENKKTKPNEEDYSYGAKPSKSTKTNGAIKAPSSRKRAAVAAKSDDEADDEPKTKKAKATKATKAKGKAASKADPEPEETKEEKVVAEGQFIKKKDVTIPLDEHCPLSDHIVYVDPDSGMIYDASLNQSNSSNNNNKFYRIQVSKFLRGVEFALILVDLATTKVQDIQNLDSLGPCWRDWTVCRSRQWLIA